MEHLGLTLDDFEDEDVEVWPENQRAYYLFAALQTQWRAGAMGLIGLDHNVLFHRMGRMGLGAEEYDELDADIRVMELAALETIHTKD